MSVKRTLDNAIRTIDEDKNEKYFEFIIDYTERKTGKKKNNVKSYAAGSTMNNALSAMRSRWSLSGFDIVVKDVKKAKRSDSEVWIHGG